MKRLGLIMGLGALLALMPLGACSTGSMSANAVSLTSTSAAQSHSMAAAENLYTAAATATAVWVRTAHPSVEVKQKIDQLSDAAYAAIVAGRTADAKGDSPGVAAALTLWNKQYGNLKDYLTGLGVPVPASP